MRKTNNSNSDCWWWTPLPYLPLHKRGKILKIPFVSLISKSVSLCLSCHKKFTKLFFFFKFLILSTGLSRQQSSAKIAARWRYRLPNKLLHWFGILPTSINMSTWGLNIIQLISSIFLCVCIKSWSSSHHVYAEKSFV